MMIGYKIAPKPFQERFISENFYDKNLFESDNFRVIPSLGSLLSGWVLIIPKLYCISLSQLSSGQLDELEMVKNTVSNILVKEFGYVTIFEHGPKTLNTMVGCGVDYAHLHLLPLDKNLIETVEIDLGIIYEWQNCDSIKDVAKYKFSNTPYLYLESFNAQPLIARNENIPSQLFRKAIAMCIEKPNMYDWKLFPEYHNIEKTIQLFNRHLANNKRIAL